MERRAGDDDDGGSHDCMAAVCRAALQLKVCGGRDPDRTGGTAENRPELAGHKRGRGKNCENVNDGRNGAGIERESRRTEGGCQSSGGRGRILHKESKPVRLRNHVSVDLTSSLNL